LCSAIRIIARASRITEDSRSALIFGLIKRIYQISGRIDPIKAALSVQVAGSNVTVILRAIWSAYKSSLHKNCLHMFLIANHCDLQHILSVIPDHSLAADIKEIIALGYPKTNSSTDHSTTKDSIMTNSTFSVDNILATVKADAKKASYATAANLGTEVVKMAILKALEDHTSDSKALQFAETFLASELGTALIHAILGMGIPLAIPGVASNPHAMQVAENMRVKSFETVFTVAGMELVGYLAPMANQLAGLMPDKDGNISAANIALAAKALEENKRLRVAPHPEVEVAKPSAEVKVAKKPAKKRAPKVPSNVINIQQEFSEAELTAAHEEKAKRRVSAHLKSKM
jgi:hypothetical protein